MSPSISFLVLLMESEPNVILVFFPAILVEIEGLTPHLVRLYYIVHEYKNPERK